MTRQYPLGTFTYPDTLSPEALGEAINAIATLPQHLQQLIKHLSIEDFEKTYREGSWNVAQIIHHLVDSHLNAYIRLKFNLLEDNYTAKLYQENDWVATPENTILNALSASELLKHLHFRWKELLLGLTPTQWQRLFYNPYSERYISTAQHTALYAWHSKHHLEHIRLALSEPLA